MAVDLDRVPAERRGIAGVEVEVPLVASRAGLAQSVDVDDRGQSVESVERSLGDRLPHGALGHLRIAAQDPGSIRQPIELLAGERDTDPDRQALAERAGGDVGPRQDGRRVAFQPAAAPAVGHQLLLVDRADGLEDRVVQRRGVALGEDQVIVVRVLRVGDVVMPVLADEHGHELRGGHATTWGGPSRPSLDTRIESTRNCWARSRQVADRHASRSFRCTLLSCRCTQFFASAA